MGEDHLQTFLDDDKDTDLQAQIAAQQREPKKGKGTKATTESNPEGSTVPDLGTMTPRELDEWRTKTWYQGLAHLSVVMTSINSDSDQKLKAFVQFSKIMKESSETGAAAKQAKEVAPVIEFRPEYLNTVLSIIPKLLTRVGLDKAQQLIAFELAKLWIKGHGDAQTILDARIDDLRGEDREDVTLSMLDAAISIGTE